MVYDQVGPLKPQTRQNLTKLDAASISMGMSEHCGIADFPSDVNCPY